MKPIPAKALGLPRMTAANAQLPTRRKYKNQPTTVGEVSFDSKAEARRFLYLQRLEQAGEISDLKRQVPFELIPGQVTPCGKKLRPTTYIADFTYRSKDGKFVVEDPKGASTPEWRIKRKLMLQVHGIWVQEIRS